MLRFPVSDQRSPQPPNNQRRRLSQRPRARDVVHIGTTGRSGKA